MAAAWTAGVAAAANPPAPPTRVWCATFRTMPDGSLCGSALGVVAWRGGSAVAPTQPPARWPPRGGVLGAPCGGGRTAGKAGAEGRGGEGGEGGGCHYTGSSPPPSAPPPHKCCRRRTTYSPRQYEDVGCGGRCHCGGERRDPRAREGVDGPMRALAALGAGYGRARLGGMPRCGPTQGRGVPRGNTGDSWMRGSGQCHRRDGARFLCAARRRAAPLATRRPTYLCCRRRRRIFPCDRQRDGVGPHGVRVFVRDALTWPAASVGGRGRLERRRVHVLSAAGGPRPPPSCPRGQLGEAPSAGGGASPTTRGGECGGQAAH